MTEAKITPQDLAAHRAWLSGEAEGKRLVMREVDLRDVDLRDVDLRSANLRSADLRGANLRWADLRCAYLRWADLRGAFLSGAYLGGAFLSGAVGIHRLPVGDPRGGDCVAVWHADGWRIAADHRWLTVARAREYWGRPYHGEREIGDRYLYALDWLAGQPEPKEKP